MNFAGFPGGSMVKNLPANAGDSSVIPGSRGSSGEGNSNLLQYSCLENSIDREAWWATVHGITESNMTEQLSTHTHTHTNFGISEKQVVVNSR